MGRENKEMSVNEEFTDKEYILAKSEKREQKRSKQKKMKISGLGARLLQRVLENKANKQNEM